MEVKTSQTFVKVRQEGGNGNYSLAGEGIDTVYEVTVTAIHTVGLLCVVAFSGVA